MIDANVRFRNRISRSGSRIQSAVWARELSWKSYWAAVRFIVDSHPNGPFTRRAVLLVASSSLSLHHPVIVTQPGRFFITDERTAPLCLVTPKPYMWVLTRTRTAV
jgi:hypothetical protein